MLDFFVNPNHVPLIVAVENGFFAQEGIEVEILVPGNPSDPVKLAAAVTIDIALTPQINFLIAKSAGLPLIAVGSLIDGPLGGLLSLREAGIETLSDLRGRRIGYSLAPLEPTLWRTMLASVGVEGGEFELVNVGFNTVLSLLTHRVDAIGAFRNFELSQVALLGHEPIYFPQEEYGVPDTAEIILVANPNLIEEHPTWIRAFLNGLSRGISFTKEYPEEAYSLFLSAHPDLDDELNHRAYDATLPLYADEASLPGQQAWEELQYYLVKYGLMEETFPLEELYITASLSTEEGGE
jgi:putative hydroxymethylpyrimidine transport system substrate-binding protein